MAEQSGFFDAHLVNGEYDRIYLAASFAKYFASFIGNGIFGGKSDELMVRQKSTASMSVNVLSGQGWINGYWYENNSELSLAIDVADGVLNRIDLIVLRWDGINRNIRLYVKKGTPAVNASAPALQRNADYYELKLAEIYIRAGTTSITQANITDTRLNSSVCGFVVGVVKQFDTEAFGKQLDSYITQYAEEYARYLGRLEYEGSTELQNVLNVLKSIATSEDISSLALDVSMLKQIAIESNEYKGCFYRTFEGRMEWINPPSQYGNEYCTTERWQNKPVYQRTFYIAALPDTSYMSIDTSTAWDNIVSVDGYALDNDNLTYYPFPIILDKTITPAAAISSIESDGALVIYTTQDMSMFQAYVTVKYTKS